MSQRKLQQEMDRVFKRVAEGIVAFDALYDKVQQSTNQSQKEKLEQDLKREIKKLQRLRDQIKTWMGSNEIKDKKVLTEQRRLIEVEMERFKACEKEMKTKAYSKEGLTNSARMDPREKEKHETSNFISSMLEELDRQIEALEAEQESIQGSMKKGKKDSSKAERISEIENCLERHRWHQSKMEMILRMVENGTLEFESVNNIQEDIKYYVESNQDADFAEDEEIYDELNLVDEEEPDDSRDDEDDSFSNDSKSTAPSSVTSTTHTVASSAVPLIGSAASITKKTSTTVSPSIANATLNKATPAVAAPDATAATGTAATPKAATELKYASAASGVSSSTSGVSSSTSAPVSIPQGLAPLPPPPKPAVTASTSPTAEILQAKQQHVTPAPAPAPVPASGSTAASAPGLSAAVAPVSMPVPATTAPWAETAKAKDNVNDKEDLTSRKETTPSPTVANGSIVKPQALSRSNTFQSGQQSKVSSPQEQHSAVLSDSTPAFILPPGLQDLVNSFDAARKRIGSPPPISTIAKLLESSYLNCPDSSMSERPRYYHPKSPFPTPAYYPQEPLTGLEDASIVGKMDVDTLFYIFYYRQGSYQQYLAAKELKNRSWRFHKRFLTWFQRHEEPKVINNEFEQGTYRYFDFEGIWLQRRKSNFKFEYQFLEDEI